MKKYNKIMGVFTTTITELEKLKEKNFRKTDTMTTKKIEILAKAEEKVSKIEEKVVALSDEAIAATKAAEKIKEFLS